MLWKSDSGTVRVRGGGGATAVRDGPGEERRRRMFFWEFTFKIEKWLLPPRSSRLRSVFLFFFSLSKLSVLFFFALQESGTDPNRPVFRPAILH